MDTVLRTIAGVMLALILGITLSKQGKDMTVVLTVAVCCMGAAAAITFLKPVLELMVRLETAIDLDSGILNILLKGVGIAFVAEITELICSDAGFGSLGKVAQLLGHCSILYLSVPMITDLLSLLQGILGNV
jgi:stage III sporulation protein AD